MDPISTRRLLRWFHIAGSLALGTYVYSPWGSDRTFHAVVAYGILPAMGLSGLWMWQQARLGRLLGQRVADRVW